MNLHTGNTLFFRENLHKNIHNNILKLNIKDLNIVDHQKQPNRNRKQNSNAREWKPWANLRTVWFIYMQLASRNNLNYRIWGREFLSVELFDFIYQTFSTYRNWLLLSSISWTRLRLNGCGEVPGDEPSCDSATMERAIIKSSSFMIGKCF